MLSNTLNTNEIKDASGTEVEFQRLSQDARATEFAQISETPNLPYRMVISHQEVGEGVDKRRRSLISFRKTVAGSSGVPRTHVCNVTLDTPIGDVTTYDDATDVLANALSFCATTGAATTVLFDGTGTGGKVLLTGGL